MTNQTRFTKTHEWVRLETDGTCAVGITNFAQAEIRDIVFIELPKVGKETAQGAPIGSIESVKAAFEIYAPISGKIAAVNEKAAQDVTLVHKDAEGQGWLFKIAPTNPKELESLLGSDEYKNLITAADY